jgi:hypothetical protein
MRRLSDLVGALKRPARIIAGLFLFCLLALLLDHFDIVNVAKIGTLARPLLILGAALCGSLLLGDLIYDARSQRHKMTLLSARRELRRADEERGRSAAAARALSHQMTLLYARRELRRADEERSRSETELRRADEERRRSETEARVLKRLDYLSKEEIRIAANCLRKNEQSFTAWAYNSHVANLIAKDLVRAPGGTYHRDNYPNFFADFVWQALLARRDEFIAKDDENQRKAEEEETKEKETLCTTDSVRRDPAATKESHMRIVTLSALKKVIELHKPQPDEAITDEMLAEAHRDDERRLPRPAD